MNYTRIRQEINAELDAAEEAERNKQYIEAMQELGLEVSA